MGCGPLSTTDSLPKGRASECCTAESQQCEHLEIWKNFSYLPTELLAPLFFFSFLFCKFCKLLPCLKHDPENPPLTIKREKVIYWGKVNFPSICAENFKKSPLLWIKRYRKDTEVTVGIQTVWTRWREWSSSSGWVVRGPLCEKRTSEPSTGGLLSAPARGRAPQGGAPYGRGGTRGAGARAAKALVVEVLGPCCSLCSTRQLQASRSWCLDIYGLKSPLKFKKPHLQWSWILVEEKNTLGSGSENMVQRLTCWSGGVCCHREACDGLLG